MTATFDWFTEGGFWMYLILLADITFVFSIFISLLLAVLARLKGMGIMASKIITIITVIIALIPLLVGALGYIYGMHVVNEAISYASEDVRGEMYILGTRFARIPLIFGLVSTVIEVIFGLINVAIVPWGKK